jgi:hypothetical protein
MLLGYVLMITSTLRSLSLIYQHLCGRLVPRRASLRRHETSCVLLSNDLAQPKCLQNAGTKSNSPRPEAHV